MATGRPVSQADLVRRLAAALGIAARAVQATVAHDANPSFAAPAGRPAAGQGLSSPKVIAEASMLLFCAAPVQDADQRIRDGIDMVARLLIPHARSDSVLAAICLDPGLARDHAVAHVILSHLGYPDHDVDRALKQSLAMGPDFGPERLPHRELEQRWLARLGPAGGAAWRPGQDVLARSSLGRPMDALGSALLDKYAFTHAVLYASDLGRRAVALPRPAADVAADADAALACCLDADDFDLITELLWTWPMLGLEWSAAAAFAFGVLTAVEDEIGFVPGREPGLAALRTLPADRLAAAGLASYHTAVVMGLLCAAALRTGRAPPAAGPDNAAAAGAAADAMRLIAAGRPEPQWHAAFRALAPRQRGALAGLVLTVVLQRARRTGDMELLRDALQTALRHDLLDGPVPSQAVALFRRGTAVRPADRGLAAAAP